VFIVKSEKIAKSIVWYLNQRKNAPRGSSQYSMDVLIRFINDVIFNETNEVNGHITNHISKTFIDRNFIDNIKQYSVLENRIRENYVFIGLEFYTSLVFRVYADCEINTTIMWVDPSLAGKIE